VTGLISSVAMVVVAPPIGAVGYGSQSPHLALARTVDGWLRGNSAHGVDSFLGVPYAAPPVGDLRWRPPQPLIPWNGLRRATTYGNRCPQLESTNGPGSDTEDCLYLNVQRPRGAFRSRLPVYVFFHGGGNENGSGDQHDGSKFVREGRIIVVTVNYRLGVFGALAHPALSAEGGGDSGNYSFLDQQASLRWVQSHIADFGGDPARVTIGGESSGAFMVCSHLSAPGSQGLFAAAVIESGSGCWFGQPLADAERAGTTIADAVGCPNDEHVLGCLRGLPPEALVDKTDGLSYVVTGTPTVPTDPRANLFSGAFAHVPVLIGGNLDEARTFLADPPISTEADYRSSLQNSWGDSADTVFDHYPWSPQPGDNGYTGNYLLSATFTDAFFACATREVVVQLAARTPTFVYEFSHREGPGLGDKYPGYVWGAGHAAELPYMWPSFDNGLPIASEFDSAEKRLAGVMVAYWSSFVVKGQPAVHGLPRWPSFNHGSSLMSLDVGRDLGLINDASFTANHQCAFWAGLLQ